MKQPHRKKSDRIRQIANDRIIELFRQAEIRKKTPEYSGRYIGLALKISTKYKVKIPKELKRRFCKTCHAYFVFGENCRVRLNSKKIVYYCMECKNHMRFPYH